MKRSRRAFSRGVAATVASLSVFAATAGVTSANRDVTGTVCGKEAPNENVVGGAGGALCNAVVFVKDAHADKKVAPVSGARLDQKLCRYPARPS